MTLGVLSLSVAAAPAQAASGERILRPGETLMGAASQELRSANGRYRLVMQLDGNLVLYSAENRALWWTGTLGGSDRRLIMQHDGNLVIYNGANRALWSSGSFGAAGAALTLQDDGNPVVATPGRSPVWSAYTGPLNQRTTVSGVVACANSTPVGIWVNAAAGGSGFARLDLDIEGGIWSKRYTFTLPNGGAYSLNVGCGGSSQRWGMTARTEQVTGSSHQFLCGDIPGRGPLPKWVRSKLGSVGRSIFSGAVLWAPPYGTCERQ